MSEANNVALAPACIVIDCNEWIRLKWLGSPVGRTLISALRADPALRLAIPEVLEGELNKHRADTSRTLLSRLKDVTREIGMVTGNETAAGVVMLTEEGLDVAMRERLAPVHHQVLYPEMRLEEVRRALHRVNAKTPPNVKNQQMKDTLLWEACLMLAAEQSVFFVTADRAFYAENDPSRGLASELAAEKAVKEGRLKVFAAIDKALPEFAPHRAADSAELPDVRVKDLIAPKAAQAFRLSATAADLRPHIALRGIVPSYLRTDVPHVFAVSFAAFFYINRDIHDQPNGEAAVTGQCQLDARTASIDSMSFEAIHWTLTDPSGGTRKQEDVLDGPA